MSLLAQGSGVGVSQAGSNLLVTTGTNTNAEFLAVSNASWLGPLNLRYQLTASQRIANANFMVLLADLIEQNAPCSVLSATSISVLVPGHGLSSLNVGQSMMVGGIIGIAGAVPGRYAIASIPDANHINFTVASWPTTGSGTVTLFGWNFIQALYNGVTATSVAFDSQQNGWNSGQSALTINTTAAPGHLGQITHDGLDAYYSDMLAATTAAPAATTRGSRVINVPDNGTQLCLFLWSYNGSTAPASTTTWTLGAAVVEVMANVPNYLAGIKLSGQQAALPASITGNNTPTLGAGTALAGDVGIEYRANNTGAATSAPIMSPAVPIGGSIKSGSGRIVGFRLTNLSTGTRSVKIYNAITVTMGTTAALFEIDIPTLQTVQFNQEGGIGFSTGIMWAVTSGIGLTDNTTTSLAANDVTGFIDYL
jgi:hypothetical protein